MGRTRVLLEGTKERPLDPDSAYSQRAVPAGGTPDGPVTMTVDGDRVEIVGEAVGTDEVRLELRSDGETQWVSPPLPVEIV
ncbi:MAG: hypothetical protein ACQET5_02710 [Halobacteriota archaeon]